MRGLCLSLPCLATSREPPPGPRATPRTHGAGGSGGRLSWWRRTDGVWAGCGWWRRPGLGLYAPGVGRALPSPELSSPLESNRKVPGKQPQGAARARAWNKRDPSRARPGHPPLGQAAGCRAGRRRRGVPGQSLRKELGGDPTGATPRAPERPPFPIVGLYPHPPSFPGGKLRLLEIRGQIRIRGG